MANNHVNYQERLDFIQNLLQQRFGVEHADITPIQYDPDFPYKYNNFVYRITLPSPLPPTPKHEAQQPGTSPIPPSTSTLIMRLSNAAAENMHPQTRVENEVAMMSLAAVALRAFSPPVVPAVYAWGSAAERGSQGWMLQECMPGAPLDAFDSLPVAEQRGILAQQAALLHALQQYKLPESIRLFGGVTFDAQGDVVSAAVPSMGCGPWASYQEQYRERLQRALREADADPYIQGWRANGVRKRLEAFVESGVAAQFEALESRHEKTIVHGDFTPHNLLYDTARKSITALIDYDFSCVLHPSFEFLRSFGGAGGQLLSWADAHSAEQSALRNAKLYGFPVPLPETATGADGVDLGVAKAWEDELERVGVARPRTMTGIARVADVDAVLRSVLPWRITNPDVLRMQTEKGIWKCRDESEGELVRLLGSFGF